MAQGGRYCQYLGQQRLPLHASARFLGRAMTDKKTWIITGAGRGLGVDITKAALAAGHNVVATGRNPDTVARALGDSAHLLVVKLDVTSRDDAQAATDAAVGRFGGIDVLVNNAASFY